MNLETFRDRYTEYRKSPDGQTLHPEMNWGLLAADVLIDRPAEALVRIGRFFDRPKRALLNRLEAMKPTIDRVVVGAKVTVAIAGLMAISVIQNVVIPQAAVYPVETITT